MKCVVMLLALVGAAWGQQGAPVGALQASARAVSLDVVVRDGKGHPVKGLTAKDFVVEEDGAVQVVARFDELRGKTPEEVSAVRPVGLPVNTFSNLKRDVDAKGARTVLLLDALDSSVQAQAYAQQQLLGYLKTATLGTPIAIFQLDTQIHLVQGFTTDTAVLQQAVKMRAAPMLTGVPRGYGYVSERIRMDVLRAGVQTVGQYLRQFPGRKNLIWFTARVPFADEDGSSIGWQLTDRESFGFDLAGLTDVLRMGQVSVYPVDSRGLEPDPAFSAARRGAPSAGSSLGFGVQQFYQHSDLEQIAQATGGEAFYNTNGLKQAIAQVVETGSDYYTILYYPTNKDWDGGYRKLKVQVDVEGARLEYRPGYHARRESTGQRRASMAAAGLPDQAGARVQITHHTTDDGFGRVMQLGALDPNGVVFQAHVTSGAEGKLDKGAEPAAGNYLEGKFKDKPFREFIVNYTVAADQVLFTREPDGLATGRLEFVAVVLDDKGELVNSEDTEVAMNVRPETYRQMVERGMAIPIKIQVPLKGKYFLRVGVHDVVSGKGGALEVAMGQVVLGAP